MNGSDRLTDRVPLRGTPTRNTTAVSWPQCRGLKLGGPAWDGLRHWQPEMREMRVPYRVRSLANHAGIALPAVVDGMVRVGLIALAAEGRSSLVSIRCDMDAWMVSGKNAILAGALLASSGQPIPTSSW